MPLAIDSILGAVPLRDGRAAFRVWAPLARSVAVRLDGGETELAEAGDGVWAGEADALPGDDYRFLLDGVDAWPDPHSRWQPEGVRGPSRLLDTTGFEIAAGPGLELDGSSSTSSTSAPSPRRGPSPASSRGCGRSASSA